jgi:ATPase family associated with various cellular activities (AAA)
MHGLPTQPAPLAAGMALDAPWAGIMSDTPTWAHMMFVHELTICRPRFIQEAWFPVSSTFQVQDLAELGDVSTIHANRHGDVTGLVRIDDVLVLVRAGSGTAGIVVAGDAEPVPRVAAQLKERYQADLPTDDDTVPVCFSWHDNGHSSLWRNITAPHWDDIADNYAAGAQAAIGALANAETAPDTGRLLLLHGPPGTGKSFAIRALIRAWRPWCAASVVTDPDCLFSDSAGYLTSLMTASDEGYDRPWHLLVLEDAGELMGLDARQRAGAGLSRLLNLTDGILGQGTNILVLLTTNEPLPKLHPAVRRAGRCWAEIELPPLSIGEANTWLAANGRTDFVKAPTTLAELYAPDATRRPGHSRVGFAA